MASLLQYIIKRMQRVDSWNRARTQGELLAFVDQMNERVADVEL